jgi:hypothetical protein
LYNTVRFTKSFSDYLQYCITTKITGLIETPLETENTVILENTPFLKYKEGVKDRYRRIVRVLKQVYKNALSLPDTEKIQNTIANDFNIENEIYLKNPDFIIDHFIYHIYCHNHITENYDKVLNILKVYEYLYYKTINYINEIEFDIENMKTSTETST